MEVLTVDPKQDWDRDFVDVRYQQVRKIRHRLSRKNSNLNMCVCPNRVNVLFSSVKNLGQCVNNVMTFQDILRISDENKTKTLIRIGTVKKELTFSVIDLNILMFISAWSNLMLVLVLTSLSSQTC